MATKKSTTNKKPLSNAPGSLKWSDNHFEVVTSKTQKSRVRRACKKLVMSHNDFIINAIEAELDKVEKKKPTPVKRPRK